MRSIKESIIGRKSISSNKTELWQICELVPYLSSKKGKIYDILTHITELNNRGTSCDIYIDPLSDLLKTSWNIAGFRNKAEAIEEARRYTNQINPSAYKFIGISRSYSDDNFELSSLDWDYILGIDNNRKLFIMRKNN